MPNGISIKVHNKLIIINFKVITSIVMTTSSCLLHFLASEFKAWLLYYGIPVLVNNLPEKYLTHFALLVAEGTHHAK